MGLGNVLPGRAIFGPRARSAASPSSRRRSERRTYQRLDGQGDDLAGLEPVIEHERITSLRVADPSRSPLLEAAGFRVGDRVVSIDGVAVGERRGWRAPGGRLAVYEVLRGERLMVLAVR